MYAHQIIEQFRSVKKRIVDRYKQQFGVDDVATGDLLESEIDNAVHYHFGRISDIEQVVNTDDLFTGEYGTDVRLPYPKCWFDYETDTGKGGALALEYGPELLFYDLYVFNRRWMPNPYQAYIGLGEDVRRLVEADNRISIDEIKIRKLSSNIWLIFSGDASMDFGAPTVEPVEYLPELKEHLRYFNLCLLLLNCKNISTNTNPAPVKLNKKRLKAGKPPVHSYKTLRLVLPRSKGEPKGRGLSRSGTRLHMVSGHFKTYTEAAPLFGRLTGRYWWQPQLRGDGSAGKIEKTYDVKIKK